MASPNFRMLIRNMRKMQEAGHLVRCKKCNELVLKVNTVAGECYWHKEMESR